MSRSSHMGSIACEIESAWGENSASWGVRLPHVGAVDVSGLVRSKVPSNRLVQYRNEGTMPIQTTMGGQFTLSFYLTGHGSTTAGATTVGEVETVLGHVFGTSASAGTGTTFTGGTATTPTTTAANGFTAGGIIFGSAIGSSGLGQPAVVSSHAGNSLALLTGLPAAPSNGEVCYSSVVIHPQEASSAGVSSYRFLFQTANLQYRCHGCWPMSVAIRGLGAGEVGMIDVTYGVSWWSHSNETFQTTDTMNDFMPVYNAAGSMFFNARGTATRATLAYRSVTLNYTLGIQPIKGPGGVLASQDIVGAVRTKDEVTMQVVVDSETATTAPTHPGNWDSDTQFYHLLLGLNAASTGQRVAFYFPNVCYDDRKPVQAAVDNINRMTLNLRAYTGTNTASDLTQSIMRMAWG